MHSFMNVQTLIINEYLILVNVHIENKQLLGKDLLEQNSQSIKKYFTKKYNLFLVSTIRQ